MNRRLSLSLIPLSIVSAPFAIGALSFNITFVDGGGETWDGIRQGVISQAANDWGSLFAIDATVPVAVAFTNGDFLGNYIPSVSPAENGVDIRPWESADYFIGHTIFFSLTNLPNIWWDATPETDDDLAGTGFDALTIARHEIGHLLGFTYHNGKPVYLDNINEPNAVDLWGQWINGANIFDAAGLNVQLEADKYHLSNVGTGAGDLMNSGLATATRREISDLNLEMLQLAYGYTWAIPEPAVLSFSLGLLAAAGRLARRRRP